MCPTSIILKNITEAKSINLDPNTLITLNDYPVGGEIDLSQCTTIDSLNNIPTTYTINFNI